jgi:hypothetical protein
MKKPTKPLRTGNINFDLSNIICYRLLIMRYYQHRSLKHANISS